MTSESGSLALYLLGSPRLERSGRAVHLGRRKALALLAYLSFTEQPSGRETLAALLWPDFDDSHSRGSLRSLLSQVRKVVGQELLPATDDRVGPLDGKGIWTDIGEFQSTMVQIRSIQLQGETAAVAETLPLIRRVAHLYQGGFLDGLNLGSCGLFSDWQFQQGEYLRRELCTALEYGVRACEDQSEIADGVAFGRRLVEVDPLNEEAHCALMRLYASGGQREAALRQYRLCEEYLRRELGLDPEEATVKVYESIRHSRPIRPPAVKPRLQGLPRLAVLPLRDLTGEQQWFSDGMTEALITSLSRRAEVETISYSSSASYRDTAKSGTQVAAELSVDYLVEGSVLKSGEEVRISIQLIQAGSGRHMWAEDYRDGFNNLLEMQENIARYVTAQVIQTVIAGEARTGRSAIDPDAREACMTADYLMRNSQTDADIEGARAYYQAAITRNPDYADAHAGMAFTYFSLGGYGKDFSPSEESRESVDSHLHKALELDPNHVQAHMILGGLRLEWDLNLPDAERAFQEVLRINPNHVETLTWYAFLKMAFCRFDETLELLQKAQRLDPISLVTLLNLQRYYCAVLQYRRSLRVLDRIDELYPRRDTIADHRAWVYLLMGQYQKVINIGEMRPELQRFGSYRSHLVYARAKLGKTNEALELLDEIKIDYENAGGADAAYDVALGCYGVGHESEALEWLEQAYRNRDGALVQLAHRKPWGELHWHPHFQEILGRIGLEPQLEYMRRALNSTPGPASTVIPGTL